MGPGYYFNNNSWGRGGYNQSSQLYQRNDPGYNWGNNFRSSQSYYLSNASRWLSEHVIDNGRFFSDPVKNSQDLYRQRFSLSERLSSGLLQHKHEIRTKKPQMAIQNKSERAYENLVWTRKNSYTVQNYTSLESQVKWQCLAPVVAMLGKKSIAVMSLSQGKPSTWKPCQKQGAQSKAGRACATHVRFGFHMWETSTDGPKLQILGALERIHTDSINFRFLVLRSWEIITVDSGKTSWLSSGWNSGLTFLISSIAAKESLTCR